MGKMNEILRSKLLRQFNVGVVGYTEIDRQQVEYVYRYLVRLAGSEDFAVLTIKLREVAETSGPSLAEVYDHIKQHCMLNSGRYDYDTLAPPLDREGYDRGWKI